MKLNTIKSWQVACVVAVLGFGFFYSGLSGGFQGDDNLQIVDNIPVHSLNNIGQFFESSTFWNGETLVGSFYRPMMTTTFSFIYSIFGSNPTPFHVVQLVLYMACVFVLFLFMKTLLKPAAALLVALLFLVHPINSQAVYAIPSMQEPLFFLFGISSLLLLSRSQTNKSLVIASILLLFSLLSKETGIVFACLAVLYLYLFRRDRLVSFLKITTIPAVLYVLMRANAVGLLPGAIHAAPISLLNFSERMLTVPSIMIFYLSRFIFPAQLATSYYWTHQTFSLVDVLIPLIATLLVALGFIYLGIIVRRKLARKAFSGYLFFAAWAVLGLLPYMQIMALDMTACETWIFSSLPGFLGMIAIALSLLSSKIKIEWMYLLVIPIILVLGIRTTVRGDDYRSQYTLALKDISVTKDNYLAMNNLAQSLIRQNKLDEAVQFAQRSADIYPAVTNFTNVGVIKQRQGDFIGAKNAYQKALQYGSLGITYENLGIVNLTIGNPDDNIKFFYQALKAYPRNYKLWTYLAMQEAANGSRKDAKTAITAAASYGPVPQSLYAAIIGEYHLEVSLPNSSKVINIY